MALIQVNFMSQCLMRTVTINAVIPFDKIYMPGEAPGEKKPFQTLYLLHGIFGSYTDWISGTCIQRWAEEKNLAVIMPSGENHFLCGLQGKWRTFRRVYRKRTSGKNERIISALIQKRGHFYWRTVDGRLWGNYQWFEIPQYIWKDSRIVKCTYF